MNGDGYALRTQAAAAACLLRFNSRMTYAEALRAVRSPSVLPEGSKR